MTQSSDKLNPSTTNRKKVGIVGYGYLGKAFERFFSSHYDVIAYDPFVEGLTATPLDINGCDLVVICVPTPAAEDGSADLTALKKVFTWLSPEPLILIKSAVPPGTTQQYIDEGYRICVSPEYMGESKYFTPFWKWPDPKEARMHDFFVIGGHAYAMESIVEYFTRIMGPDAKVHKMSATEAEIVKYMENSWGATKVTFANEFYEIAKAFGADFQRIREGFLADGRTERMHTMVLSDARGFGGKCFPKDVSAIIEASRKEGYVPKLLEQVIKSNEEFTSKNP